MMGVHRALLRYSRERIVAGDRNPKLAREVTEHGRRALDRLAAGLA
jgi:hypothetical protein